MGGVMSRQFMPGAKLARYQGPVPALHEVVTALVESKHFSGRDLSGAAVRVFGSVECNYRVQTSDKYVWHVLLVFTYGENKIALAIPWPTDHDNKDGSRFDRLPVVYWQGRYDQAEVQRIMFEFVAAFKGITVSTSSVSAVESAIADPA